MPARIVFITTAPEALSSFLSHQIRFLAARGFEVHTITSPGAPRMTGQSDLQSIRHEIAMRRTMHPFSDLFAAFRLCLRLRQIRPEIVQTHTPKAGLLGMIAAFVARVPIRIYTVNGLPILSQSMWVRWVLATTERLACSLATEVLCVSRSVRRFEIGNRLCPREKCRVLGNGGSHGVNTQKFSPDGHGSAARAKVRNQYGIPEHAVVLGYIGRIVPAKGVAELALAWSMLREEFAELRLLLCGYCESDHPVAPQLIEQFRDDPRVHFTSERISDMPPIYAAIDICVLPSYCEGLPNVALESGAMQVPIVATRVPGCVDAIRHGVTGLLVSPRNPEALVRALEQLLCNPELRQRIGTEARKFVSRRFSEARISRLLLKEYFRLMKAHGRGELKRIRSTLSLSLGRGRPATPSAG
jgi:glycosyltransferase involved in cell wall biosynthesis